MTPRTIARLAWGSWGAVVVLGVATLLLMLLNRSDPGGDLRAGSLIFAVVLVHAAVGAMIVARRQNIVGWIFLGIALWSTLGFLAEQYTLHSLVVEPGSLPAVKLSAWLQITTGSGLSFAPFILLFLLFPTGTPPGRWRPVLWLWWAGVALTALGLVFRPGDMNVRFSGDMTNPTGIEGARVLLEPAIWLGAVLLFASGPLSVASLVVRFRRSGMRERQQIKWLAYVGIAGAIFLMGLGIVSLTPIGNDSIADLFFVAFTLTLILGTPAAITVAILRYRLYDIDRIINRTLVYGLLTVLLAAVYVGVVVGLGTLVGESTLVVAASTLLVAALFRPARGWVQGLIDRRFYRRKYDAARTLEAFSARLREEVDLDSLTGDLVGVVRATMQPARATLWLRPQETPR